MYPGGVGVYPEGRAVPCKTGRVPRSKAWTPQCTASFLNRCIVSEHHTGLDKNHVKHFLKKGPINRVGRNEKI